MATIKTIESSFDSMTEEQKKANLATLGYIKNLASMTNTDIHRWDVIKIFGANEGANLLADKKAINKIFFEKLEKLAEKKDVDFPDVEQIPELTQALETSFMQGVESRKADLQYQIEQSFNSIDQRNRQIQDMMTQVATTQKQLSMLTLNPQPILEIKREIQEVLKAGYWVNPVVHNGFFYLNTPSNIRLMYKNRAAGIDCEIDVGQLCVRINLANFYFDVIPYKNNIAYDPPNHGRGHRFFHPHVNTNGAICWGNAGQTMQNHMKTFEIGKVLQLLYALLTTYNDGAPYVHLVALREHNKKYVRVPPAMKHPDKIRAKGEASTEEAPDPTIFDIDDLVEFEMTREGHEPRWDHNTDRGGIGIFEQGRVVTLTPERITVSMNRGGGSWSFPTTGGRDYSPDQWQRPGFLRHSNS